MSDDSIYYDTIYIRVYNNCRPVAGFSAEPVYGAAPLTVNFTNTSVNATLFEWTFPGADETTSTLENPDISYSNPGIYDVQLVVYNECGSDTIEQLGLIEVDLVNISIEDQVTPFAYPNPATDQYNIELQQYITNAMVIIYNAAGQEVYSEVFSKSRLEIPLDGVAGGVYYVKITNAEGRSIWVGSMEKQ